MLRTVWDPPAVVPREDIVRTSEAFLARPDWPVTRTEDVFRIRAAGLDWDIGCTVHAPEDPARRVIGADGKPAGLLLLHGGAGDHRYFAPFAPLLASKLGFTVVCLTYPGRLYLLDPSRNWPGDTINPDGTARTPLWYTDAPITPDQYDLIQDRSDPVKRAKWGTLFFLKARPGTEFYARMAAYPLAFEEAMKETCRRHFPVDRWSIYVHGHSTGGSFVHMLSQRVNNVAGVISAESSSFGSIVTRALNQSWGFPFNYLTVRTWRHLAKYAGAEAGPDGCWRLPWIMEDVFEAWDRAKTYPQFKAEYMIQYATLESLTKAARVTAQRLKLSAEESEALEARYRGYTRELAGPDVKPVPPILMAITSGSRDHKADRYQHVILPVLAAMRPAPRARLVQFQAGVHAYMKPEDDLPKGVSPAIAALWHEAITEGYFIGG